MCDEIERATLYSRRPRRARTSYACEACQEPIPVGSRYVAHSGLDRDNGSFWSVKQCVRCDAMVTAILGECPRGAVVDLTLDCGIEWIEAFDDGHDWHDTTAGRLAKVERLVPPDVQALAFARPGDVPGAS